MKLITVVVAVVAVSGALMLLLLGPGQRAQASIPTTGVGGELDIGVTSLVGADVKIPINTTASTDPYKGSSIHLVWDATQYTFSQVTKGTVFGALNPLCLSAADAGGAGVAASCVGTGAFSTSSAGSLLNIFVTPLVTPACSNFHIMTLNGADNGDTSTGSYTLNPLNRPMLNTYGPDQQVGVGAGACATPTPTPTASPTPTNTQTPTPTATATATPTATFTPISGAPDLVLGLFASPTAADSGGNVTYSAFIANQGNAPAQNVKLIVTLPPGGVLTARGACPVYIAGDFVCSVGTLAANNGVPGGPDETVVTLSARVPYSTGDTSAVLHARVTASNEPLANQGNNSATVGMAVRGCPDLNGDNAVNGLDLGIMALELFSRLGQPLYSPVTDLNGDGAIDGLDLAALAMRYGNFCVGLDTDHDGLSDYDEINIYHTCPGLDVQFQGLPQCHQGGNLANPLIADSTDTDGDGIPDGLEVFTFHSNPLSVDSDGDFYTDGAEAALGKDPTVYCTFMAADLDMDGAVNGLDLAYLADTYGKVSGNPGFNARADINRDGAVNGLDLGLFALGYGHFVSECP
jgi:uncharacterized repeat protein (TIGR01451 family)